MSAAPEYDIAILGGGLAGLSLAVRLAAPGFRHLRVLVAEERTDYARDRTWCAWRLGPHPFDAAVTHRWRRWAVSGPGGRVERMASGVQYERIPADRFHAVALEKVAAAPNIELRQGVRAVPAEDAEGVSLGLAGGERARLAFDTRPPPGLGRHGLAQRFLGQEVRVERPIFDPECLVLMDLVPATEGVHFTYVLPMSATCALVEDTWFAPPGAVLPDHRGALRAWLQAQGAGQHQVLFEESGCLPMDPCFRPVRGRRLVPLGGAAGAHRPATGYAFAAIQKQCDEVCRHIPDALAAGQAPHARRRSAAVRGMDRMWLALLARRPGLAPRLFAGLFEHCPASRLVRFLGDRPRAGDLAAVALATARGLLEAAPGRSR